MDADRITGVAWAHRRCWGPLDADVQNSEIPVRWNRRSLFSFGEGDLGEFTDNNDLIIYDHPFVGDVCDRRLMLDLRQFLSADDISMLERNQVGLSYQSYHFNGGIWALPIDAAATMAAWRPDLMDGLDVKPPNTLDDVFELARHARELGKWVAWAAKPTDLFCTYISMMASLGFEVGHEDGPFAPRELSADVIEKMRDLRAMVHPNSARWNPIQLFDYMASNDDVIYTPYAFNYVNYSSAPDRRLVFGASPRMVSDRPARGLLGGAGIGISAKSRNPEAAFAYAMHLIDPAFQASDYVANGGQPGMRSAWMSPECDKMTNGFFSDCLQPMDAAFLRPNIPGFVSFFHEGTHRLAEMMNADADHNEYWNWLTNFYDVLRQEKKEPRVGALAP